MKKPGREIDPANLDGEASRALAEARAAALRAYCPYSHLRVGACLVGADGGFYAGCNVENASYGLTICAERSALSRAVSDGQRRFGLLVVTSPDLEFPYPCGACLQAISEFAPEVRTILEGRSGVIRQVGLEELLPGRFELPRDPRAEG